MDTLVSLSIPIIYGIFLGGLYTVIALGLSLIFGVVKEINIAHGDLVVLGSFLGYTIMTALGIDPILSLVIGMPALFGIGFLIQRYILNRAFEISMDAVLLITFGISIILQNTYQVVWGPTTRALITPYSMTSLGVGSVRFPLVYMLNFIVGIIVMILLREFLKRTYLGLAIRAAAQDGDVAQMMGANTKMIYAFTFAIAAALAAIAGVFLGLSYPFNPVSGWSFLIIAFGIIVLGGLGSILGTFVGGMIFGLAQTLGAYFLGTGYQLLVAYIMVLVLLAVAPQGIFGGIRKSLVTD
jgi:branched-chain amino acid transport system permease protein